jgi:hypothetical protein
MKKCALHSMHVHVRAHQGNIVSAIIVGFGFRALIST